MTTAVQLAQTASAGVSFGFKNRIINGGMTISQRGTSFTNISTDSNATCYALDRWRYAMSGGGVVSSSQSSDAPAGFTNSILTTVTTTATPSAANYYQLRQAVEGYNFADSAFGTASAKTVTASFWVKSSVTGTFSFSLRSSGGTRSYVTTYTISSANTWEYKTLTVPGDTSGTWLTTNGIGIFTTWDFGTGSNSVTASPNTWLSGNYCQASGTTSLINTLSATFYLTGVQLEIGSAATSFEFRDYTREFGMCQRYYYRTNSTSYTIFGTGYAQGTAELRIMIPFKVSMRDAPTVLDTSAMATFLWSNNAAEGTPPSSMSTTAGLGSTQMGEISVVGSGWTSGAASALLAYNTANAYIGFGAEL